MKTVDMKVDGTKLMITVNLSKEFGESKSGTLIASTEGNVSVPGDEEVKIGVNVFRKK